MTVLRCGVPGCKATIRGLTGLQEAENLMRHLNRVHFIHGVQTRRYDLSDALVMRERFERQQEEADA